MVWLENTTDGQDIEDLVDREVLLSLLLLFLLAVLVIVLDFVLFIDIWRVFKEAPLVGDGHRGDVSQSQVLLLASIVKDAAKVDLGRQDLQVGEADLATESNDILVRVAFVRDHKLAADGIAHAILLRAWVELDTHGVLSVLL